MCRLEGRVAVITGAARGMGEATARLFAAHGAKVVLVDRREAGHAVAADIGSQARFLEADVAQEASWQRIAALAAETFGTPDILVNNAGILRFGALVDTPLATFEEVMAVNLTSVFLGIKYLAPAMVAKRKGSIINISSTEGLQATNGMSPYIASKWGMRGLTKAAALELSHLGVRVNSIHPGAVATSISEAADLPPSEIAAMVARQPIGRFAHADEVARVSLFLASDDASYMCGAEVAVDGGMTLGKYFTFLPGAPAAMLNQ